MSVGGDSSATMAPNGSLLTTVPSSTGSREANVFTEVQWTGTTWVTEYENQTVNTTACPIYVQKVHILPNPWDDATWILTSAFVIFTMQSGFGLLESGTATAKNEVNIMVKNAVDVIFGGITYWMVGYAFSFGDSSKANAFSGWGNFFLEVGMNTTSHDDIGWEYSKFIFQLAFATTATTIVSGAMVERTRLEAYIFFSLTNTFVYSFPSHWVWGEKGFLKDKGVIDIAGAGPVHVAGGTTGLIATLVLRPRHRRYKTATPPPMGSPTNALLGMFMLWWGWLGFNCGSTLGITSTKWAFAARSAVATICSSMAGGMVGIVLSYISKRRKFDIGYLINGVLGSLVSITALCTFCPPKYSLIIGAIGGAIACGGIELLVFFHVDDPVGVIPVHFMCGIWSLLSAGLFATKQPDDSDFEQNYNGLFMGGGGYLLGIQLAAALCITLWCAVLSFIVLQIIDYFIGLRFPFQEELLGADIVEHSIGPRKYDKIKKRLTDISRIRAYDMRRRKKYNASFKAAERYLSQKDAGVISVQDGLELEATTLGQKLKKKGKFGTKSAKRAEVYSISNGQCNDVSSPRKYNMAISDKQQASTRNGHSAARSPRFNRRGSDRSSMTRLHGALRRRRIGKVPKWQQQLGVDNLAYLEQEENEINGFINNSVTTETNDRANGGKKALLNHTQKENTNDTSDIQVDDINVIIKGSLMVDSCTQTVDGFEQDSIGCQTESRDKDGASPETDINPDYVTSIEVVKIEHIGADWNGDNGVVTIGNSMCDITYEGPEYIV